MLFLAGWGTAERAGMGKAKVRKAAQTMELVPAFHNKSTSLTCVAGVAFPAWRAGAAEGVAVVVAGPSVAAGGGVALTLTWRDHSDRRWSHARAPRCGGEGRT